MSNCLTTYTDQLGFDGLASSFLLAGAREILATQWSIESFSAVTIVSDYLKSYQENRVTEVALNKSLAN